MENLIDPNIAYILIVAAAMLAWKQNRNNQFKEKIA